MNRTIILYGAGELGKLASEFFDFYKIDYIICDDNPENYKNDDFWKNKIIIKPEDIVKSYLVLVCISTVSYTFIKEKLNDLGFNNVLPFYQYAEQIQKEKRYKHSLSNGWKHNYSLDNKKIKPILREFIFDMNSYYGYLSFFKWHFNYEEWYLKFINCNNRYFIPEILEVLHNNETFVDIGAYDGRVSKQFIENIKGQYSNIFMFEPQVSKYINLLNDPIFNKEENFYRIFTFNDALGNTRKKYIGFNDGKGYLSKINKKSKQKTIIYKLDNFNCVNFNPTFIKIHVEGYELEVLKGATKTIKQYRPIIAVTTYHTEEGLYKIPLWLIKHCKDYNFYWRNHNYQGQGAVMYCIPKERYK